MRNASVTLDRLFFPQLSVTSNYNYNPNSELPESTEKVTAHILITDEREFQVSVSFEKPGEAECDPHDIDIYAVGLFRVEPQADEDPLNLILWSGPNIVYGSIREMCTTLTSRSAWGAYTAPAVHFEPEDIKIQRLEPQE